MLGKASLFQPGSKLLNGVHKGVRLLTLLEGRGIHKVAGEGPQLAGQGLHQHADSHTGGEGMGIDDQVRPAASPKISVRYPVQCPRDLCRLMLTSS